MMTNSNDALDSRWKGQEEIRCRLPLPFRLKKRSFSETELLHKDYHCACVQRPSTRRKFPSQVSTYLAGAITPAGRLFILMIVVAGDQTASIASASSQTTSAETATFSTELGCHFDRLQPSNTRLTAGTLNSVVNWRRIRLSATYPPGVLGFISEPSIPRGEAQP
jgi:hypothetical protein